MASGYIRIIKQNDHRQNKTKTPILIPHSVLLSMLFLPILHPLRDSCTIGFNVVVLLAIEFNHNLLVESFAGFFQQNPENLGVQILL